MGLEQYSSFFKCWKSICHYIVCISQIKFNKTKVNTFLLFIILCVSSVVSPSVLFPKWHKQPYDQLIFPWTKWPPFWQTTFSNAFAWMKIIELLFKFHWSFILAVKLTITQHVFDNGLAPNRGRVIIWTNADPVYRRIYAALGGDELTHWGLHKMTEISQTTFPNAFVFWSIWYVVWSFTEISSWWSYWKQIIIFKNRTDTKPFFVPVIT